MTKASEIRVFISHAHKDKSIVMYFVDNVLKKCLLKSISDQIRCTSIDDLTILVGGDNLTLFNDIKSTILFIPFISSNYHKSEFCLLEAGAAHFKNLASTEMEIFPILDEYTSHNQTIYTLVSRQHAVINSSESLNQLYKKCSDLKIEGLPHEKEYKKELDEFIKHYNNTLRKTAISVSANSLLLNTVENSFHSESNIDFPVTLFVNRMEYEAFSMNAIKKNGEKLLWTLFGSPILTDHTEFISDEYITEYDKQFNEAVFKNKYRLIIFPSKSYADAYLNNDLDFYKSRRLINKGITMDDIITRRQKFEESVGKGNLYFTTKRNLIAWASKIKVSFNHKTFDFEFAFISKGAKNKKENYGITSGFHTNSFDNSGDRGDLKHIIIYPQLIEKKLYQKISKSNYSEYSLYKDIELQIKIFEEIDDVRSSLRKNYVISNHINNNNLKSLI